MAVSSTSVPSGGVTGVVELVVVAVAVVWVLVVVVAVVVVLAVVAVLVVLATGVEVELVVVTRRGFGLVTCRGLVCRVAQTRW